VLPLQPADNLPGDKFAAALFLQQGDKLARLGGLRVLRIGEEVYVNGEQLDSPHRPALEALASHTVLTANTFGEALEDPSFLAMLAALVNSGYWFFED